jgi:tyrosine-protein kinase Etk/Wzc
MQNQFNQINRNIEQEEQEINLKDYFNVIARYKWLVIGIFILVFMAVSVHTSRQPRIYKASAMILLETIASDNFLFSTPTLTKSSINNHIEILKSYPVLELAYKILQRDPNFKIMPISGLPKDENPLGYMRRRVSVESKRDTDILTVNFESTSRVEAMKASNALSEALRQQNTEFARMEFTNAREFIGEQLEEAELRLRASEEDLRLFKIEQGISILSAETMKLIEKSSDIEAELSSALTDFEVKSQTLDYLTSELIVQDDLLINVDAIITSPLLEQLRNELINNETRYIRLISKPEYTANHPELVSLKQEIDNGKKKLDGELKKMISIKAGTSDPLKYRAELTSKIAHARIDKNISESRVKSLREEVEKYNQKMSVLPDTELQLARMERSFVIDEKTYTMLIQKHEDAKIAERSKIGIIRLLEEAQLPGAPIKPNKRMNMMIAIVLGLGLGMGSALLLHALDSKIRTFDDIKKFVNLPVLGTIPYISIDDQDIDYVERMVSETDNPAEKEKLRTVQQQIEARLISHYAPKSSTSEAFRILRTNILNKKKQNESLSMVITSSGPKEGKSTILSNLAVTLAQMDVKVILVDMDLRRPMVHQIFNFEKESGMSDILYDKEVSYKDYIKKPVIRNLDIITSGYIPPNPSELLASPRMESVLSELKKAYDYVLIDAPPVIAVTDTMIIAKKVDILALVVRVELAEKNVVKRIKEIFDHIEIAISGVVINGIQPHRYYSRYEYNYYYYYYYAATDSNKKQRVPKVLRQD